MNTLTAFIVIVVAVNGIIEIWHHSHIMAGWRARIEARGDWLSSLMGCPFCMSPWLSAVALAVYLSPLSMIITIFAIARAANLLNDILHSVLRTPRTMLPDAEDKPFP